MLMEEKYSIKWTFEAQNQVSSILEYLKSNWNEAVEDLYFISSFL